MPLIVLAIANPIEVIVTEVNKLFQVEMNL